MKIRILKRLAQAGLAVAMLTASMLSLADGVVVASTSSKYQPGNVIGSGQGIELSAGESLRLLTGSGQTLTVQGPHAGPVDAAGGVGESNVTQALTSLLSGPSQDTSILGATRSAVPANQHATGVVNDDIHTVNLDVTRSGSYCVPQGASIVIPRPDGARDDRLLLSDRASGATETLSWGGDGKPIPWPEKLPLQGGLEVLARLGMLGGPVRLQLTPIEFRSEEPGAMAVQLIEQGCRAQAWPLLQKLAAQPL